MKRLIYLAYLGLLALILISCQKETIAPDGALAATPADEARTNGCVSQFYLTKTGIVQLGNVRTDYVLIGFNSNVTLAQQQAMLSQYNIFEQLDGDFFSDSGIITIVKLNSTATCASVSSMINSLERKRQVNFAGPVFDDPNGILAWIGQTNEIMVTLKDASYYPQLQRLARMTRTTIVTNLWDETYLLSADKHSAGNALQMTSILNVSPFIALAEPNFLAQSPALRTGDKPERKLTKAFLPMQAAL
ncbi:hypothetical protein I5M27_09215 [Adhaeribacter sp. BT258]|uniref:Uncharacterized protein n=1 Tax=Adhaeribacter terrigena TaxID=2793070 RepID=A0ABS1C1F6_9BACT|nr:hypothetical protein [Adhaeribacter terrigena]MBK0403163.1 hypothetical protein [Adhaeribacter terrigena]